MFRSLIDRVVQRRHSVQYEVQRMTHKGGWRNYYGASLDTPPSKPESDDDIQIVGTEEGRFRCIRRKDGHIDSVVWEWETQNSDLLYTKRRRKTAQRKQLDKMNIDEIRREVQHPDNLDCLSVNDLMREILNRKIEHESEAESDNGLEPIAEELVREIADREGSKYALSEYRELIS